MGWWWAFVLVASVCVVLGFVVRNLQHYEDNLLREIKLQAEIIDETKRKTQEAFEAEMRAYAATTARRRADALRYAAQQQYEADYKKASNAYAQQQAHEAAFNNYQGSANHYRRPGYRPPPAPERFILWRQVLGFTATEPVTAEAVKSRFKRLAKTAHPDKGGTTAKMTALIKAREDGLKACQH